MNQSRKCLKRFPESVNSDLKNLQILANILILASQKTMQRPFKVFAYVVIEINVNVMSFRMIINIIKMQCNVFPTH